MKQKHIIMAISQEHVDGIELAYDCFKRGIIDTEFDMGWLDDLMYEAQNPNNPWQNLDGSHD